MPSVSHPRPWHRGSLFGPGQRRLLDADARRAWRARAELERRAGRLTALYVVVGEALVRRLGVDGRCDPSHATLALDAACSERTVRRALAALRVVGLLSWEQRVVRRPWPEGGRGATRAEQTSNAYELRMPGRAVEPRVRPVPTPRPPRCGGQGGRGTSSKAFSSVPDLDPAACRQALQALAATRSARFAQEWAAKRAERWGRMTPAGR